MISKKEHDAALRRVLRRFALIFGGAFLMAAAFYLAMGQAKDAAALAVLTTACVGYGLADGGDEDAV